jgi:hypothetical protein
MRCNGCGSRLPSGLTTSAILRCLPRTVVNEIAPQQIPLSYKPAPCLMIRMENIAVNRAERIRYRAFNIEARRGNLAGYWKLVNLSREVGSIRVGE